VVGLDTQRAPRRASVGKLFVDCTGHGSVGALADAEFMMEEKGRMGMSNMWVLKKTEKPSRLARYALGTANGDGRLPRAQVRWPPSARRTPVT
jgi:hypothetical protein